MQRYAVHVDGLRHRKESNVGQSGKQEGQSTSGPSCSPWTDPEIRVFLQEWEVVERRGGTIFEKSWALCQRLSQLRGLRKSWEDCSNLLLSLQDLHRTLCNERAASVPLFSPYSEALYRILGPSPGPVHRDCSAKHLAPRNHQPSRNQTLHYDTPVSSAPKQGNPLFMMWQRYSLFPGWQPQKKNYSFSVQLQLPTCGAGDPGLQQQPWSTED